MVKKNEPPFYGVLDSDIKRDVIADGRQEIQARLCVGPHTLTSTLSYGGNYTVTVETDEKPRLFSSYAGNVFTYNESPWEQLRQLLAQEHQLHTTVDTHEYRLYANDGGYMVQDNYGRKWHHSNLSDALAHYVRLLARLD